MKYIYLFGSEEGYGYSKHIIKTNPMVYHEYKNEVNTNPFHI